MYRAIFADDFVSAGAMEASGIRGGTLLSRPLVSTRGCSLQKVARQVTAPTSNDDGPSMD